MYSVGQASHRFVTTHHLWGDVSHPLLLLYPITGSRRYVINSPIWSQQVKGTKISISQPEPSVVLEKVEMARYFHKDNFVFVRDQRTNSEPSPFVYGG